MVPFLIWLLILVLIFGAIYYVVDRLLPLPDNIKQIAKIILAIILVIVLVDALVGPGYLRYYPARLP